MEIGVALLLIAGFFCVLDILLLATGRHVSRFSKLRQGLTMGGALSVWGSQLLLLKYILDNNFSYKYVLEHSSTHLSLELKLSVLWVGQEGSLLLWTSLLLLFYFVFRHIFTKYIEEKIVRNSFIVASLLCLTFITITIISNPFALTDDLQQEGWGLNPLLRTVWNVIHPPVVFMGYAASMIPLSIVIAKITQRDTLGNHNVRKKIYGFLNLQMALTWTFLTLGIIMGGYWAYITLGWGGYWAWDPVETSSLIAWLFCTAYFHGRDLLEPWSIGINTLIFLTYFSVIFATFITRSGILSSIHGFADSPVAQVFLILMFGSLLAFVSCLGFQLSSSPFSLEEIQRKIKSNTLMLALFTSLICIIGLTMVCSVGIIYPMILSAATGKQYEMEPTFFNRFSSPFVLGLTISSIFCIFPNPKRSRTLLTIACTGFGLGLVSLFLGLPTANSLANLLLPLTVTSLLCTGMRVLKDCLRISKKGTLLKPSSHTMLHFGLALILLGVLISSNTQSTTQGWCNIGSSIDLGNIVVELDDLTVDYINPHSYTIRGSISIFENGGLAGGGDTVHGVDPDWGSYYNTLITSNLQRDVYVSLHNIRLDPNTDVVSEAYLEIRVINLISLVWAGSLITLIAISTMLVIYSVRFVTRSSTLAKS